MSSLSSWSSIRPRLWSTAGTTSWLCTVLLRLCHSAVTRLCDAVLDPVLDVAPSEANMPADAESWRALAVVSPRVDRSHRHAEILGEIFNSEQPIGGVHCVIFRWNPLIRVSVALSTRLRFAPRAPVRHRFDRLPAAAA